MKHKYYECDPPCVDTHCNICDGGLAFCTVCGGAEGSLTTECRGEKLEEIVLEQVYHHGLDFYGGKWHSKAEKAQA